jgi:Phosphotransferase enzyme family
MSHLAANYLRSAGWSEWNTLQCKLGGGIALFFFIPGEEYPSVVGKLYTDPIQVELGRRECEVLGQLAPFAEQLGIPRLLLQNDSAAGFFYMQSGMAGNPLPDELNPADDNEILKQLNVVGPWLERFQHVVPAQGDLASALCGVISGEGDLPRELRRYATEALPLLAGIPTVPAHGDFWAQNVLLGRNGAAVVDWGTFHYGAPVEDLLNFCISAVFPSSLPAASAADFMWDVFFGDSAIAIRTQAEANRILAVRGLAPDLLRPLFLQFVLTRLGRREFIDNPAWQVFARRFAEAGAPAPWSGRG